MLRDAEREHKIKLQLSSSIKNIKEELENNFINCKVKLLDENSCLFISKEPIALFPILQLLDNTGISVYEAKELKPSLEEVFVKITNINPKTKNEQEKVGK